MNTFWIDVVHRINTSQMCGAKRNSNDRRSTTKATCVCCAQLSSYISLSGYPREQIVRTILFLRSLRPT